MKGELIFSAMGAIDDAYILAVADVLEKGQARKRRPGAALILAAVLALLLAACAVGVYFELFLSDKAEHPQEKLEELWLDYEQLDLVLSFTGPEKCRMAGFKANYLPSEPDGLSYQADGIWCRRVVDESVSEGDNSGAIPYNFSLEYVSSEQKFVFGGKTKVIKVESKGNFRIIELEADLRDTTMQTMGDSCKYLLIFDSQNGYFITIYTTLYDIAELEKIAANMEIYVYTESVEAFRRDEYSTITPGRG